MIAVSAVKKIDNDFKLSVDTAQVKDLESRIQNRQDKKVPTNKVSRNKRDAFSDKLSERQLDWMYEFNNNATRHYVLLAAGEFNSRTGRLTDHQRNRVPSLDVVDFSKLYNVEGVADPLTVHPWLEKGCGNQEGEKGCFGYPYDCVRYASCRLLATYKKNGNRLSMQLQVRNQYFRFH